MINNFNGMNMGKELDKERAEELLEKIGFFKEQANKDLFGAGDIRVFEEPWMCELAVILQPSTGETVFYDFRSA